MKLTQKQQERINTLLRSFGIPTLAQTLKCQSPAVQIFLVGGFVRDLLLNRKTKDIDLVVRGVPPKKLRTVLKGRGSVNLVGKNFGVFKFVPRGKQVPAIDIALPRTEHAFGTGGYRDVSVKTNWKLPIEEDLSRRDFTVNALAYNLNTRTLIDPFGGLDDLKNKAIRAVGNPKERFEEDYSRLLRALRFACQLNFHIEPKTWTALRTLISRINARRDGERAVPYEVIAKELLKAFTSNPPAALDLFDRAGAVKALIPELLKMKKCPQPKNYHSEGDVWQHTLLALRVLTGPHFKKEFDKPPNAEVIFGTLFHDIAKPLTITMPKHRGERIRFDGHDECGARVTQKIAERLKLSSHKDERIDVDAERLAYLVRHHLLLISGPVRRMRATTIERYYLRNPELGQELLAVQFADAAATLNPRGKPVLTEYRAMRRRIQELLNRKYHTLPSPLLNGHTVMRLLKIPPGTEVGRILTELREAQLTGKVKTKSAALKFVLDTHSPTSNVGG